MKKTRLFTLNLIFGFFILTSCFSQSQEITLGAFNAALRTKLNIAENQIEILNKKPDGKGFITDFQAKLINGELILEYQLKPLEEKHFYKVNLQVNLGSNRFQPNAENLLGDFGEKKITEAGQKQITWTNLGEDFLQLESQMTFTLTGELWGPPSARLIKLGIECSEPRPAFNTKQQLPYYATAVIGAGLIGASYAFKGQADNNYEKNYLTQTDRDLAESFYDNANQDRHIYLILKYTGLGIIAVDALLYTYRQFRTGKKKKVYDEECRKVSFRPVIQPNYDQRGNEFVGLRLIWNLN